LLQLRIPRILVSALALITFSIVISLQSPVLAQNTELFGGASFVRANPHFTRSDFRFNRDTDQIGFDAALTRYFGHRPIGITFDVGGSWRSTDPADSSLVTAMAGPTIKARGHRVEPFVHALVGVGRFAAANQQLNFRFDKSTAGWAYAAGGGLDLNVNNRFAIRAFQADYLSTRIAGKNVRNLRAGIGVVLRF